MICNKADVDSGSKTGELELTLAGNGNHRSKYLRILL